METEANVLHVLSQIVEERILSTIVYKAWEKIRHIFGSSHNFSLFCHTGCHLCNALGTNTQPVT